MNYAFALVNVYQFKCSLKFSIKLFVIHGNVIYTVIIIIVSEPNEFKKILSKQFLKHFCNFTFKNDTDVDWEYNLETTIQKSSWDVSQVSAESGIWMYRHPKPINDVRGVY